MATLNTLFKNNRSKNNGIGFLDINENLHFITYNELYNNALQHLAFLQSKGLQKGSFLIFQFDDNQHFIPTLWACFLGGIIAVPVSVGNNDEHRLKLFTIFKMLGDAYIISDTDQFDSLKQFAFKHVYQDEYNELEKRYITIQDAALFEYAEPVLPRITQNDTAFIQFSSGSTGDPKGVVLTHKKILVNNTSFITGAQISDKDTYLSWFPLTHDMGLLGWHIYPLLNNITHYLIPTKTFVRKPMIWMNSASKYGATILCSPNFGYRHFLKLFNPKRISNWDLSKIRLIFNGAEPISADLCDEFLETLESYGLKNNAMYTVYGLAEATLAVAFPNPGDSFRRYPLNIDSLTIGQKVQDADLDNNSDSSTDSKTVTYVDVGSAIYDMHIKITDDHDQDLAEDYLGHILIKSESVLDHYYANEEATKKVQKEGGWVDTGDLGFLREGNLIITGRSKDIIIKNGLNYYPHDIERICEELEEIELNKIVFTGIRVSNNEDEKIVAFVLYKKDVQDFIDLKNKIQELVLEKLSLNVDEVIPVKSIPKTTSGKIQRHKLAHEFEQGTFDPVRADIAAFENDEADTDDTNNINDTTTPIDKNELHTLTERLCTISSSILKQEVNAQIALIEQGFTSITLVALQEKINKQLKITLDVTDLFNYPTLEALSAYILTQQTVSSVKKSSRTDTSNIGDIAIISMGCRFPEADTPQALWELLIGQKDAVRSSIRWDKEHFGGFLNERELEAFDAALFGIIPKEVEALDPQQRLILKVTYEALHNAFMNPEEESSSKNIGVFIGASSSDNLMSELDNEPANELNNGSGSYTPYSLTGNMNSVLAGRIAYLFGFSAPCITVDTACSSSLSALHLALNSLKNGECELAIAGGVNLLLDERIFEGLETIEALSPTGKCKTFDESADGYVRGEGAGVVILKPLQKALEDEDRVLAVINASALNHDGKSNGLTVPNGKAQEILLQECIGRSGLSIDDIDYIEAHGTGTKLGDPIEVNALAKVFKDKKEKLTVGSIKSNIGHLEAAAGIASVCKAVMMLRHGQIPQSLHILNPNRFIDWNNINVQAAAQASSKQLKAVGVSSFGLSGTNAHVILSKFEEPKQTSKTPSLQTLYKRLELEPQEYVDKKVAFVFTGQGSQYKYMAKGLYEKSPVFKEALDRCDAVLKPYLPYSIASVLFDANLDQEILEQSLYTQLSIICIEYALAQLWMHYGIKPSMVLGHSIGEYIALVISEVISLEDALMLVFHRASLVDTLAPKGIHGGMRIFLSNQAVIEKYLSGFEEHLSIAVINTKNNIVVSGFNDALEQFSTLLKEKEGVESIALNVATGFHSVVLDSILEEFEEKIQNIECNTPATTFISTLDAKEINVIDTDYFVRHLRHGVRFADAITYAYDMGYSTFLEIGPGATLSSLVKKILQGDEFSSVTALHSLHKKEEAEQTILKTAAFLSLNNFDINFDAMLHQAAFDLSPKPIDYQNERYAVRYKKSTQGSGQTASSIPCALNSLNQPTIQTAIPQAQNISVDNETHIKNLIFETSGIKPENIDIHKNIFELGLDSLVIFQIRNKIKQQFGFDASMKDFYTKYSTVSKLLADLPEIEHSTPALLPELVQNYTVTNQDGNTASLVAQQMASLDKLQSLFQEQLNAIKGQNTNSAPLASPITLDKAVAFKSIKSDEDPLSSEQQEYLQNFIAAYSARTKNSKEQTAQNRQVLADWINSVIYRQSLKEMVYPITVQKSNGAHITDIDGNDYIDISMGYGSVFLGHNHEAVNTAIQSQLENGFAIAPQTALAYEAAQLIREFTGVERVCFSNTGTEAVMAALRIVRAASGKRTIIKFQGSFHGTSDTVLASGNDTGSIPTSLGVLPEFVQDIVEFSYANEQVFEYIKNNHHTIAGILVEPVQSRKPELQPKTFLQQLSKLTKEYGIALIFDEMITGFRTARGGASEIFEVQPDIRTFGKVAGGGMPIGIIAGDAKYLDYIDGGQWQYEDGSYPQNQMITFGGTFCKHPLTLQAVLAALNFMKEYPTIQEEVNARTADLAARINALFKQADIPAKVNYFGSLFKFEFYEEFTPTLNPIDTDLFFYVLMHKGIYTWEKRICFLSAAHTDEDIERIVDIVKASIDEMKAGGFFLRSSQAKAQTEPQEETLDKPMLESLEFTIDTDNINQAFPLNDIQQAYWMGRGDVSKMGNIATHGFTELHSKDLDIERFISAWQKVIARHDMLRTVIDSEGYQTILPKEAVTFDIPVIDCTQMEKKELKEYLLKERQFHSHKVLDTTKAPILDVRVYKLPKGIRVFLYIDMLVCDATSIPLFMQDLKYFYENPEASLPDLAFSFRDYVLYEKSFEETLEYDQALDYWRSRLQTLPAAPQLPLASIEAKIEKPKNLKFEQTIDAARWSALKAYARTIHVTPNVLLMGIFSKVLAFWSKQSHFTMNLTLFNRLEVHPDVFKIVGDFTSLTLLEIDADLKKSFETLCRDIQTRLFDDLDNRLVSAVQVLRELREAGRELLMPVVFTSTLGTEEDYMLDWIGEEKYLISQTPQVWIDYQAGEHQGELNIVWDCIDELFPANMLNDMFEAHLNLLEALIDNDSDTALLPSYQSKALTSYNDTEYSFKALESSDLLHTAFLRNVQSSPNTLAIITDELSLSYQELHNLCVALYQELNDLAISFISPNDSIAIYLDKGYEQIISVLTSFYKGAAYLPIASDLPKKRVQYLIKEVKPKAILTSKALMKNLKEEDDVLIIDVHKIIKHNIKGNSLKDQSVKPFLKPLCSSTDLAYTIFTSGSTGTPKGVMITHEQALNTVEDINEKFEVTAKDKIFAISALNFDLSVYDIFGALSVGASLVVPKEEERKDSLAWKNYITNHNITLWNSAPALMTLLISELEEDERESVLASLRLIMLSGDYIPISTASHLLESINQEAKLISLGGATEGSIWSIYYPITSIDKTWKTIPYGYPLSNQQMYILNDNLEATPFFTPGEIYIGGQGVALGYFNDQEKTEAAFIDHPQYGRLYKTGDLGLMYPDTNNQDNNTNNTNNKPHIEFIGRIDNQVQVQGYRVELSEIESSINNHEAVKTNATIVVEEQANNSSSSTQKTIAAFIVPKQTLQNQEDIEIEEAVDLEGFLNDPVERLEFKLAQHGNRRLNTNETSNVIKLKPQSDTLNLSLNHKTIKETTSFTDSISKEELAILLHTLSNKPVENNPLPKYFYPSAGSLYPMQVFVYIPSNTNIVETTGYYYYDRADHNLVLIQEEEIKDKKEKQHIQCYFIAKLDAIEPMYGPAAKGFCYMETGHMSQLFEAAAAQLSIGCLEKKIQKSEATNIHQLLNLDKRYILTKQLTLGKVSEDKKTKTDSLILHKFARQSFRTFQRSMISQLNFESFLEQSSKNFDLKSSDLKIYVYFNDNAVDNYTQGFYRYKKNRLSPISEDTLPAELYQGRNRTIYDNAAFSILFVSKNNELRTQANNLMSLDDIQERTLINAGLYGQLLMNHAPSFNLGLCSIGFIDTKPIRRSLNIKKDQSVIYSFLGGSITKEQMSYWAADEDQHNDPNQDQDNQSDNLEETIKSYLKENLPEYMIPTLIKTLDHLPITKNGKIDKKALQELAQNIQPKQSYTAPRNETETKLTQIFEEVLQKDTDLKIGIYDNFFELGGHSLLAAKMVNIIRKEFQIEFAIRELFTKPTVAQLAQIVAQAQEAMNVTEKGISELTITRKFEQTQTSTEIDTDDMFEIEL
jgi:amino acid adenylation domain-containing protein